MCHEFSCLCHFHFLCSRHCHRHRSDLCSPSPTRSQRLIQHFRSLRPSKSIMRQQTQKQHSDRLETSAIIDLSSSSSEEDDDSDDSIDIVAKEGQPRAQLPVPTLAHGGSTFATTAGSSSSSQFRHPATILPQYKIHNNSSWSKPFIQPRLNQASFASTSAAFNTSAKSRAMSNMTTEHAKLGLPISVPKIGSSTSSSALHAFKPPPPPVASTNDQERRHDLDLLGLNGPADGERALRELVESTMDMENVDLSESMPENMNCTLLPHQVLGVHWLKDREKGKKRGGILADDVRCHPPRACRRRCAD